MITNNIGKSPLTTQCAFKSECSVFITPTTAGSEVTIILKDGNGNTLGTIFKGVSTKVAGIFLKENQAIEVEINGGGYVFVSLLEENTTLKAGVHFSAVHYVGDAITKVFALPLNHSITDIALLQVFFEGQETRDFTLSVDGLSIAFKEAPFLNAEIDIFLNLPQS